MVLQPFFSLSYHPFCDSPLPLPLPLEISRVFHLVHLMCCFLVIDTPTLLGVRFLLVHYLCSFALEALLWGVLTSLLSLLSLAPP